MRTLRIVIAVLLIANVLAWAWAAGMLEPALAAPGDEQREPQRIAQQLRPQLIGISPMRPPAER